MATCSIQDSINEGACYIELNPVFRDSIQTALLCNILQALDPMAQCDIQALINSGACYIDLSPEVRDSIQTQLLCDIREAIGSGQQTCLLCGTEDPTETPSCDCALYYKRLPDGNQELWFWDVDTASWVQSIGGAA